MRMNLQIILTMSVLCTAAWGLDFHQVGRPENNILTLQNRDHFTFSVSPQPLAGWGNPRNVADERESWVTAGWSTYGDLTNPGNSGAGYIQVDLKTPYIARAFAITGFPAGSRKPTGEYFLEGSSNGHDWKMVAIGKPSQWHAPGTYPFRKEQIVPAIYPSSYRYYRVIAMGWTNGHMLVFNWGLFV